MFRGTLIGALSRIPCYRETRTVHAVALPHGRYQRITDPLFDSTEKTGSAPPGGLNDMVSLTNAPIIALSLTIANFSSAGYGSSRK